MRGEGKIYVWVMLAIQALSAVPAARLDTTQIYTEVSIVKLREVHARTHPTASPAAVPDQPPSAGEPSKAPSQG